MNDKKLIEKLRKNELALIEYNRDKHKYTYNNNNRLIKEEILIGSETGFIPYQKHIFKYYNNLINYEAGFQGIENFRNYERFKTYNKSGQIIKDSAIFIGQNDTKYLSKFINTYLYDAKNRLIEEITINNYDSKTISEDTKERSRYSYSFETEKFEPLKVLYDNNSTILRLENCNESEINTKLSLKLFDDFGKLIAQDIAIKDSVSELIFNFKIHNSLEIGQYLLVLTKNNGEQIGKRLIIDN